MHRPWEEFSREKLIQIFTEKKTVIDIGGGLRVDPNRNNRFEDANAWLEPYIAKVDYKVLDKVPDFHPDIVGDIHELPLPDNSVDALICVAVLEHVEEPHKAVREMHRVLKPGGYCFIYVPFLFYYHPMKEYYQDFFRFTYDGVKYITKDFSSTEIQSVHGAIATVANLLPAFSKRTKIFEFLDKVFKKQNSKQTSGYIAFCTK